MVTSVFASLTLDVQFVQTSPTRGMRGVYQHCSEMHLHRYLAEFDFRYSNRSANGFDDVERSGKAMSCIVGKRLIYAQPTLKAQTKRAEKAPAPVKVEVQRTEKRTKTSTHMI